MDYSTNAVNAVEVINVLKNFRKATVKQTTTLKTAFVNLIQGKRKRNKKETLTVLNDISFAIKKALHLVLWEETAQVSQPF